MLAFPVVGQCLFAAHVPLVSLPRCHVFRLSDVLFAVDSIPAVFGVTTDPFIAFSSNAFALLGLRALYTIIAAAVDDFVYLRPAIAVGMHGPTVTGRTCAHVHAAHVV